MFKKILSLALAVSILNAVGVSSAYADTREEKEARFTERVREGINKLGTGTEARVQVKLRNKTKLKGYISKSDKESFTIVDVSGAATEVAYPQVKQVKGRNNLSGETIAPIAAGILIIIGVLIAAGSS